MKRHANLSVFVPHEGCPRRCIFCDQNEISGAAHAPTPDEVRALCERYLPENGAQTEIAFFGGSFTAIERGYMRALLEAAYPFVQAGRAEGIRLSTRPDAIDDEILDLLAAYGVTSIELGAQSMDDAVLNANRRGHTAADARRASALIKARGRFALGLQMMLGMYGERDARESALYTAREFIALAPATVRIYPTLVMENTALCALYRAEDYAPLGVEAAAQLTAELLELFEGAGINVIRVGLHGDASLQKNAVAGPFHPAFGELCYSLVTRKKLAAALAAAGGPDTAVAAVHPTNLSRTKGLSKCNIDWFRARGTELTVKGDEGVPPGEVRLAR